MKRGLLALLALFGAGLANAEPIALERGQVWTFKDAPLEETRVIIGDIEPFHDDVAVSVSITGMPRVQFANGQTLNGTADHVPFSEAALRASLEELVAEDQPMLDGYADGYATWKEAVETGRAGIFTISLAEVVTMFAQIAQGDQ